MMWRRIKRLAYGFYAWWSIRETRTDGVLVSREGRTLFLEFPVPSRTRWRSYFMVAVDAESLDGLARDAAAALAREPQAGTAGGGR